MRSEGEIRELMDVMAESVKTDPGDESDSHYRSMVLITLHWVIGAANPVFDKLIKQSRKLQAERN